MNCKRPCGGCIREAASCADSESISDPLASAVHLLLAACERVLERWETHDGQMNHVDDVRAAVAAGKQAINKC
jgi:hypothetical protein